MKILITGNMGYVGSVLGKYLKDAHDGAQIIGYDAGFFAHNLTGAAVLPEVGLLTQHFGDVREFPAGLMDGVDAVVNLAAVSNDPMGKMFETVTEEINFKASIRIAELAKERGVSHFVFASSCSMYGAADGGPRKESDDLNPLTAYARSKVATEDALGSRHWGEMVVTALRFSTACGMSERLRLDLVLNDFVACALSAGEITVLSDGSPWRPLIDVKDMCRAIDWAITRRMDNGGPIVRVNVGSDSWNYQVKDLAEAVSSSITGTKVRINKDAPPDKRSYSVDFSLFRELAPNHQPTVSLERSIMELRNGLQNMQFGDANFRDSNLMRLKMLQMHMADKRLNSELRWQS